MTDNPKTLDPTGSDRLAEVRRDARALVDYCWDAEKRDYEECERNGNSRIGHIFLVLQRLDRWAKR